MADDMKDEIDRLKSEGKKGYGVNSMAVEDFDHKAGINTRPRVIKMSRSPRHDPENVE